MTSMRNQMSTLGGGAVATSSKVANLGGQGDSTQAFIDCIMLYAKNLEADAVSVELQVRECSH